MENNLDIVYAEVYEILKNISKEKVNLIPKDVILKIKNGRNKIYKVNIDWTKEFDETDFLEDTINILGYFNYAYWTKDKKEKEYLKSVYLNNLNKKICLEEENVISFGKNKTIQEKSTDIKIIENKKNFPIKIKNNIKNTIKKLFK